MDWIRQNNFLAAFSGIMLVGVLGLGYFAFSSWKGYSQAVDTFDSTSSKLENLEGKKLHPNPENLAQVESEVDAHATEVDSLFNKLLAAQKPLPTDVQVTEFGTKIKAQLDPFMESAKGKMIVGDSFYMGMDRYRDRQPDDKKEVLQWLEWQLMAISKLADLTLESGVDSIDQFMRYPDEIEIPPAAPVAKKKPRPGSSSKKTAEPVAVTNNARVQMRVTGSPDAITKLFNLVSNDPEYFYWIRWAKVGNEKASGPMRQQEYPPIGVDELIEPDPNAAGKPVDPDVGPEGGDGESTPDGGASDGGTAPEGGVAPVNPDEVFDTRAKIDVFPILGTELVRASIVIDMVRFNKPPEPEDKRKKSTPAGDADEGDGDGGDDTDEDENN